MQHSAYCMPCVQGECVGWVCRRTCSSNTLGTMSRSGILTFLAVPSKVTLTVTGESGPMVATDDMAVDFENFCLSSRSARCLVRWNSDVVVGDVVEMARLQ